MRAVGQMVQTGTAAVLFVIAIAVSASAEPLSADTPVTTAAGNPFTAPAEWTLTVQGKATIIEAPEGGSQIVIVDVAADDAESAVEKAWEAYKENKWSLKTTNDVADAKGWTKRKRFEYQTSPNERRAVVAYAMYANELWTVWIYDVAHEVGNKRSAQVNLIVGSLLPKGYSRETFENKTARRLDQSRIAELTSFVENALEVSSVPGTSLAIIQDGEVVFSGGFGVRELGKPEKVDGDTLYMVASNTKGLTTLLLAKLVDEGRLNWKDRAIDVMPSFKLGDEDTTARVLVEHLICACTGLPRQDMEWIFEFGQSTPESTMELLGTMQPTSDFGDLFQYSNVLAAGAGYLAGYARHPDRDLGSAYDTAMQDLVFDPLGMTSTTFDYERAQSQANHARPHSIDVRGDQAVAEMRVNYSVIPVRPAGAAWSSVNDMIKYLAMELAEGTLPDGSQYISKSPLLERRLPIVPVSEDHHYGMGLMVDEYWGIPVVHHGGDMIGFHSDMMWLPDHGVGAVVLTNGDPGWLIRNGFRRKLLEVLFDGKQEADATLISASERFLANVSVEFELLEMPANETHAKALADRYRNDALGNITVTRSGGKTMFDFDEWQSEMGSRINPDETVTFATLATGIAGMEFLVGDGPDKTLILRDAQHEYVFEEVKD